MIFLVKKSSKFISPSKFYHYPPISQPNICNISCRTTSIIIIMIEESQNKIYYKGNPYTRQNYIPHSALKNRTKPSYLVQLPQGQDFFGSSRKKQYADVHYDSQIKKTGLFEQGHPTYYHGTYEVSDIEGAASNSLISEAVRNRMKGNSRHHNRAMKASHAFYNNVSMNEKIQENQFQRQKTQLEKPRFEKNYHFSRVKHIQTQPIQARNFQLEEENSYQHNPELKYGAGQLQTEGQKIKHLEQQLFESEETRLKEKQKQWRNQRNENPKEQLESGSEKTIEVSRLDQGMGNRRSLNEINSMWHGDTHKIMLYPSREIRKLNPTYLSTENYVGAKNYHKYYPY